MSRSRKYRNKIVDTRHGRFDSAGEARRFDELVMLERAGEISGLRRQVSIPLHSGGAPIKYDNGRTARLVIDFAYIENGRPVYEDFKGMETPQSKLKRAIARAMGLDIRLSRSGRRKRGGFTPPKSPAFPAGAGPSGEKVPKRIAQKRARRQYIGD